MSLCVVYVCVRQGLCLCLFVACGLIHTAGVVGGVVWWCMQLDRGCLLWAAFWCVVQMVYTGTGLQDH